MNIDDLLCVGAIDGILISSTINRNARAIPGEALGQLISGTEDFLGTLREYGVGVHSGGGHSGKLKSTGPRFLKTITSDAPGPGKYTPRHTLIDGRTEIPDAQRPS